MKYFFGMFLFVAAYMPGKLAHADCLAAGCAAIKFEVKSCVGVDPTRKLPLRNFKTRGYPSYKGAILIVKISEQKETLCDGKFKGDFSPLKNIAPGAEETVFVPLKEENPCEKFESGAKFAATYSQACCDGDPNPPCLLGFSGYIFDVAVEPQQGPRS